MGTGWTIRRTVNQITHFIMDEVWSVRLDDYPPRIALLLRYLRVVLVAFRRFFEDKVQLRASGLTFYSLLALVPILAMAFGISKGFGFDRELERYLTESFKGQEDVLNWLMTFVHSMLNNTKGGVIAGVGMAVLFWSVMKVLGNIESSFNDIWQIRKQRTYIRKFTDYLSLMLVAPILIIASGSGTVFVATQLSNISSQIEIVNLSPFVLSMMKFLPYAMIWLLFTLLYMIMPNTKVSFKSALIAGILAGSAFQVVQWIYIDLQMGVSRYNTIYGSFAALPLLLVWMQTSWLIVLLGAEISFANQNIDLYELENESLHISPYAHRAYNILLLQRIVLRFIAGEAPLSSQELSESMKLPTRLVRMVTADLLGAGLINEIRTDKEKLHLFMPAKDVRQYTVKNVMEALDRSGNNRILQQPSEEMKKVLHIQERFLLHLEKSPENILIQDLPAYQIEEHENL
ncbi:MAG: YihY/virulence factor BrkB family protein [Bacteroidales bacterium]|jgi:membrane protein|nr:YihY/virulence factor BrkB family protein [Bacteroidales bacterium]